MKIGPEVQHDMEDALEIVCVKTYRLWLRDQRVGRKQGKTGRPRLTRLLRELILHLARKNTGWGVRRILGELKKLAVKTVRSFVQRMLVDEDILPDPDRRAPIVRKI